MRVRLTAANIDRCHEAINAHASPEHAQLLRFWLDEYAHAAGRTQRDIIAPAACWRVLRRLLEYDAYTDKGFRRVGAPSSLTKAIKRISEQLAHYETHPALSGAAMLGIHTDILPVWSQDADKWGRVWNPYPIPGSTFALLVPTHHKTGTQWITSWSPGTPSDGLAGLRLFQEAEHLSFA
jgi:hypothetical protein